MAAFLLAQTSDNTGGGAALSLWFLLGLFIIVAAVLWFIYARPHGRVPPRPRAHAHGASATGVAGPPGEGKPPTPPGRGGYTGDHQ